MKFSLLFLVVLTAACHNEVDKKSKAPKDTRSLKSYVNKPMYNVHVGDTIEIYHSTNSCCKYCQPNTNKLKHVAFIGSKLVLPEKKGCEGCNQTSAYLFVAQSIGIDTLKDAIISQKELCKSTLKGLSTYVVRIE